MAKCSRGRSPLSGLCRKFFLFSEFCFRFHNFVYFMPRFLRRRRYSRRYRRRSRLAKLRRYGNRLRRGLDVTVQPGTVRDFDHIVRFKNDSQYNVGSQPIRINGLGKVSLFEDFSLSSDIRYTQCCGLYSEFRILSMNIEVIVNGIAGTNLVQGTSAGRQPVEELSRMFIMATVNRSTTPSLPFWTYALMKNAPGTIVSRNRSAYGYPRISLTIFPSTLQERTSWIPTRLNNSGANASYAAGNIYAFSPSVDFLLVCPGTVNSKWFDGSGNCDVSVSVICRYRLMFRNASGTTVSASAASKLQERLRLVETGGQDVKIPEVPVIPVFDLPNKTKGDGTYVDDEPNGDGVIIDGSGGGNPLGPVPPQVLKGVPNVGDVGGYVDEDGMIHAAGEITGADITGGGLKAAAAKAAAAAAAAAAAIAANRANRYKG